MNAKQWYQRMLTVTALQIHSLPHFSHTLLSLSHTSSSCLLSRLRRLRRRARVSELVAMETCSRVLSLEQISFNRKLSCNSDFNGKEQGPAHQPESGMIEVICPEPRNATRVPSIADSLNICYNTKRNLSYHNSGPNLDVINLFLGMDDFEDELDVNSNHMGLFNCSPPVRSNNPLVHDVWFTHQSSIISSPTGNTHVVKHSSARVEASSRGNNASEKPTRRVVGFNCGGSKSHCISAFA